MDGGHNGTNLKRHILNGSFLISDLDGSGQDCGNSIANALGPDSV